MEATNRFQEFSISSHSTNVAILSLVMAQELGLKKSLVVFHGIQAANQACEERLAELHTEQNRLERVLEELASELNRLKMEETLEHELNRSSRYQSPLSIAMFDIDYFKKVNDTYGHADGDEVLRSVAAITQKQLRDVDFLSRLGGEEFLIISAETSLDQMHHLAERVRQAIAEHTSANGIRVTASFGVGQYEPGETQKELLKRVDDALYLAKQRGRNQVRLAHSGDTFSENQAE